MSGIDNVGHGKLACQGYLWKMVGNGVEMYCDSSSLWVIDASSKEVVIEPVIMEEETRLQTNPAVLFVHLNELFNVRGTRSQGDDETVLYILDPKRKDRIDYFNVEISKRDSLIKSALIALKDGSLIKIEVSSMKLTPVRPIEDYRPRIIFDSSWIVTDLR
jgi:hypothetical protein